MAFVLDLQTGSHGWPLIIDKSRGITVNYRGPQPEGTPNVLLHMPDGDIEATVFDETQTAGKTELDVLWTVHRVRGAKGMKQDVTAALKEALETLSFRKQAIKMKEVPVVKSVTVDFGKTVWE
jgi:hypothetical protein